MLQFVVFSHEHQFFPQKFENRTMKREPRQWSLMWTSQNGPQSGPTKAMEPQAEKPTIKNDNQMVQKINNFWYVL